MASKNMQSPIHNFVLQNDNQLEFVDETYTSPSTNTDDAQKTFVSEAIAAVDGMLAVAKANAKRLKDAIAVLEMELSSTEVTESAAKSRRIDSSNATHFSEFPIDQALEVE